MPGDTVLSRHRLPRFYRVSLTALWLLPGVIFGLVFALRGGLTLELLDPRLALPVLVMVLPALYIWQEGVDVLQGGIIARVHVPRYYDYAVLTAWSFDERPDRHTLTVWDYQQQKVLECRAGHLTDLPLLLVALNSNVSSQNC
jgi:hypothetical protein